MIDVPWLVFVGAGALCFAAGMLGWMKNPRSSAATVFMVAMIFIFVSTVTAPLIPLISTDQSGTTNVLAKASAVSILMADMLLWLLCIVFPIERKVSFRPVNIAGALFVAAPIVALVLGLMVEADASNPDRVWLDANSMKILLVSTASAMILTMVLVLSTRKTANDAQWRSGSVFLAGMWIYGIGEIGFAAGSMGDSMLSDSAAGIAKLSLALGIAASGLIFAYSIARGQMTMMAPVAEAMASSEKASFRLEARHVYIVEEEKPDLSFEIFTDILKGRCFDCENDDSFQCESLECASCKLPCPCRECTKYKTRPQGIIVTRQFPNDVRTEHFIQTTPIVWLSTVAGKDNMDPAKLSLLTDYLVNFMERSHNSVVLVDGIEYLVTSNDFQKVLRSVDRWNETAMTSNSRLILSLDPRVFESKELALLEKNKEIVKPEDRERWQVFADTT